MKFIKTEINGAFIIESKRYEDNRGFFINIWDKKKFQDNKLNIELTEGNIAFNKKAGTIRGLHYQLAPYEGAKLVRCTRGKIFDITLDLRTNSKTFKQWIGIELSADNYKLNYIPEGCAHGYQTLEDDSEVFYLMSQIYNTEYERCVNYLDPMFNISWPLEVTEISKKDKDQKILKINDS